MISSNIQPSRSVDSGKVTVLAHSDWAVLEEKQEYFGLTISSGGNSMMFWPDDTDHFQLPAGYRKQQGFHHRGCSTLGPVLATLEIPWPDIAIW